MSDILVSAIITTYKRPPETVERAIKSIERQTYKNIEIIVVDDSPETYAQREAVKEAVLSHDNVKYIAHEKNKGACAARNTGLYASSGEYVAYLDDDDEWLPEKIEKQISIMTDEVAMVYGGYRNINEETGETVVISVNKYTPTFDELLLKNFVGSTSCPLIKKKVLQEVGGFDEELKAVQDYDVWLKIAKRYAITYVDAPLIIYHVHSGEQISKNSASKIQGFERINNKYSDYLKSHKKPYWKSLIVIIPHYLVVGQKKKAWRTWFKCVCLQPQRIKGNIKYLLKILAGK